MSKKVIVYGNQGCPDCVKLKELFDREGIRYGEVDVLAGLGHFKKFLLLRDTHKEAFGPIIAQGKIGIPAVVVDDTDVYAELKADEADLSLFR
ncbi:MAG: glutaredoxin [Clostridiales bacterium]|nr:glutaredoxin [Clostridiales bacterium]